MRDSHRWVQPGVLAIDVTGSICSKRVIEVLSPQLSEHGALPFMRCDNGLELLSHAIPAWIAQLGIATVLNDPGKPPKSSADESCNGKFGDQCLAVE